MMFLASFLGCMFAQAVYPLAWGLFYRIRYGKPQYADLGEHSLAPSAFGKIMDASHALQLLVIDMPDGDDPEYSAKILASARDLKAAIPAENAERMRMMPRRNTGPV